MANLFQESDFELFTQYQGKTQAEAPEGFAPMRQMYDKLGNILEGLQRLGYHTNIRRNPLAQAGPGTLKYCDYHWARIYPKEYTHFKECEGKLFFVIGTTQDGFNVHIDTNSKDGFDSENNEEAKAIKCDTWWQLSPEEASQKSLEELVADTDQYIQENWVEFNKFASIYGVQESIKILNNMELEKIKKLLLGNHNLILTGAPGTGKTYLAKQIARAVGATDESIAMVQFHPSYDYTDFVEGLRPVGEKKDLGFERKDGVFKAFCKEAITALSKRSFGALYRSLTEDIAAGRITTYETLSGKEYALKVEEGTIKYGCQENGTEWRSEKIDNIQLLFDFLCKVADPNAYYYNIQQLNSLMAVLSHDAVTTVDHSEYIWTVRQLIERYQAIPSTYVFIIDEINRGEISKIFGELFFSIDAGYRGTKGRVNTQYQNLVPKDDLFAKGFYIPENLYIIGTMNDIDRSVESMDFAMRRRFAWKEITAESRQSMLDEEEAWGGHKPALGVIAEMKVRMNNLNACIIDQYLDETLASKDKIGLTKAYQIGASYFLKYATYGNFDELWENHIEGLLYEYLRGSSNIESKIERLHRAYNDTTAH